MQTKSELEESLKNLLNVTYLIIGKGLKTGRITPDYEEVSYRKLIDFSYNENGITKSFVEGEKLRPYWGRCKFQIWQKVKSVKEYGEALRLVSQNLGKEESLCHVYLDTLIDKYSQNLLTNNMRVNKSAKLISSLLTDLAHEPQKYRALVKVTGLILHPESIQLDTNTKLRKPKRSDFNVEIYPKFSHQISTPDPTAFLYIIGHTSDNTGSINLHEIDTAVGVLRLFRVGAVQYFECTTETDSIIHMGAGALRRIRLLDFENYTITQEDVKLLKEFWLKMKRVKLPVSAVPSLLGKPDELSIAYERYTDTFEQGVIEKRIASAIMGLEALYLTDNQEMKYKLSMRTAKLLGLLGYNVSETKSRLNDAYDIRSNYVHGATSSKKRQDCEKKYGDFAIYAKTIKDYLRTSIVALLNRPPKKTFVDRIDENLLDSSKEAELKKLLFLPYEKETHNAAS